jgi:hypothetical protein
MAHYLSPIVSGLDKKESHCGFSFISGGGSCDVAVGYENVIKIW